MSIVRPPRAAEQGTVVQLPHVSEVLRDNPWGDPVERSLPVYLPPGYDAAGKPLVALWDLAAFTNSGPGHLNWRTHGENLVQRLDRLISEGTMPPVAVPMPDCYTSLGGNQYINSNGVGRYSDYLHLELIPLLESRINVHRSRDGRGLFGKSSGGYGALYHAMHAPDTWGGLAAHAADCGFENVYRPEFPWAARTLSSFDGDVLAFLRNFWSKKHPGKHDFSTLMVLALAASYDPDPERGGAIRLPFDLYSCTLIEERWARWLAHDPLNLVETRTDALAKMHCVYLDVGSRDQFHIQFGMRALAEKLEKRRVRHYFEEFDGLHTQIDWRLDTSLPMLAKALCEAVDGKDTGEPN